VSPRPVGAASCRDTVRTYLPAIAFAQAKRAGKVLLPRNDLSGQEIGKPARKQAVDSGELWYLTFGFNLAFGFFKGSYGQR